MENKIASAYCNDVLGTLDGVELARLIGSGKITAAEAVEAATARARKVNPKINAIAAKMFEQARVQAGQSIKGPFGGVPSFIKDTDDVKGVPTRLAPGPYPANRLRPRANLSPNTGPWDLSPLGKALCRNWD
ncbi:MAG: hypothetical protein HUN05_01190 [Desulfobacter sp.]|nr:MAG: hypothetical protein HUN05_01190 [Desulfobacter sp.]